MGSRPSSFVLTQPGPLRLYSTAELLRLPPPQWLVDETLPEMGFVALYGEPECGKSFTGVDLALSVASGLPWGGCEVQRGYVLYISAEGGPGIGERVHAWLTDRNVRARDAQVAWLTESMMVSPTSEQMEILVERVQQEVRREPSLVIIDTLARCFEGDENLQKDMNAFVAGVDQLRMLFRATVVVVHHTGREGDRERGSTVFRGAADTMMSQYRAPNEGLISLTCTKQKEAVRFEPLTFRLVDVPETGSAVLRIVKSRNAREKSEVLLAALAEHGPLTAEQLTSATNGKMSRRTVFRALLALSRNGDITKENGLWAISAVSPDFDDTTTSPYGSIT